MRWAMRWLAALAMVGMCAGASAQSPSSQGRRVALVIGNSAYVAQGTLSNPGPDSRLVADALRRVGFQVTAQTDLGKAAMERSLRDFSRAADGAEVALVYYAGHGLEANGVNWLLPVDAVLADERDLSFEAINLDAVLGTVERAQGLRMVVLDACRNNPFARSMRRSATTRATVPQGLADVEVAGTLVLYAARGGTVAQDGPSGGNSPFASAFAHRIPEPGVDIRLLVSKVRDDVLATTNKAQEPFSYGSLPGVEIALTPGEPRTGADPVAAEAARAARQRQELRARLSADRTWMEYQGSFYRLTSSRLPIEEARAEARAQGGYLVAIGSPAEQSRLVNAFEGKGPFWIGLSDEEQEGVWKWSNGEPFVFRNWKRGEPSGSFLGMEEDYVVMSFGSNGEWTDVAPNNMRALGNAFGIIEVRP